MKSKIKSKGIRGFVSLVVNGKPKEFFKENLLTNDGRDLFHAQCYTNTSAGTRGSNYIALTETSFTPAATDTSLTGEIATNGLSRAVATTITHTDDTNSTTLAKTFTASGSFTSVLASALFNASSGVTMTHEANFSIGSGILVSGDTLTVTWTINLG
jgi:hypothetical protein